MVEYIEYKGKKYAVRVSYYALKMTRKESGKDQVEFDESMKSALKSPETFDIEIYETMLWYSLVAGAEFEGVELDLPREKIEFVLDGCFYEFMTIVENFQPKTDQLTGSEKKVEPKGNRQQKRTGKIIVDKPKIHM